MLEDWLRKELLVPRLGFKRLSFFHSWRDGTGDTAFITKNGVHAWMLGRVIKNPQTIQTSIESQESLARSHARTRIPDCPSYDRFKPAGRDAVLFSIEHVSRFISLFLSFSFSFPSAYSISIGLRIGCKNATMATATFDLNGKLGTVRSSTGARWWQKRYTDTQINDLHIIISIKFLFIFFIGMYI